MRGTALKGDNDGQGGEFSISIFNLLQINYILSYKSKCESRIWVKYLCEHECERSSVPMSVNMKAKVTKDLGGPMGGLYFILVCVATVMMPPEFTLT